MTELFNKLVAAYKKSNENVSMSYPDAQKFVTTYWSGIKDKQNFEQLANDKLSEWKRKSLKRKGGLLSYWGSLKKTNINKEKAEETFDSSVVIENDANPQLASSSSVNDQEIVPPNETEPTPPLVESASTSSKAPQKKNCHAEVEIDAKILTLTSEVQKLEEVLRLNVMPNQEETRSTIETKKAELSKLLKRKRILKQNRENQKKARERKIMQVQQRDPSK